MMRHCWKISIEIGKMVGGEEIVRRYFKYGPSVE